VFKNGSVRFIEPGHALPTWTRVSISNKGGIRDCLDGNEIYATFCSETEQGKSEMGELYALDFDGVICDSCGESSVSAVKVGSSLHSTQNNFCFLFENLFNFQRFLSFFFQLLFPL